MRKALLVLGMLCTVSTAQAGVAGWISGWAVDPTRILNVLVQQGQATRATTSEALAPAREQGQTQEKVLKDETNRDRRR